MKITVEYAAQVKRATGIATEVLELDDGDTLHQLGQLIAAQHGDEASRVLMQDSQLHPSILIFVDDQQTRDANLKLADGQSVTFLSPISGG